MILMVQFSLINFWNKPFTILMMVFCSLGFSQSFSNHYLQLKAQYEKEANTPNEIIFLGNSITEGGDFKSLFPNKNIVNRGISGDVIEGILYRLDEVTDSKPNQLYLMIGTNDLARGKSVDYVVSGIYEIINRIKKSSPSTEIYLQSILPVNPNVGTKFSGHKSKQNEISRINDQLKVLSKELNVHFIDLHKKMRNAKGDLKEKYTHDGLHLKEMGYIKWKKSIYRFINK